MKQSNSEQFLRGLASTSTERVFNKDESQRQIFKAAFDAICNPKDWKLPINCIVSIHEEDSINIGIYLAAVEYFTGTKPIILLVNSGRAPNGKAFSNYRIISAGYYLQD